ncbi:MAG TPA: sigma-70 family RNA polymerase sigma factor [Pyrinomonadaceae bacterium]
MLQPKLSRDCAYQIEENGESEPGNEKEALKLLRRVAEGDAKAFWKLWELYRNYLYTVCLRQMGGVHADAEDALSRVMIKAWDKLPGHAGKIINLKAWLARMANNLCVDIHRERKRQLEVVEHIEEITVADLKALAYSADSPEEMMLQREMGFHLLRLINALSPNLRQPFVLRFLHGVNYEDIALRLKLSNDNVRKRVQQARAFLRDKLREELGPVEPPEEFEETGARLPAEAMMRAPDQESAGLNASGVVRLVPVILPSGCEMSFQILIGHNMRQNLKIETLDKYVQNHPNGWKKRWELSCSLYKKGHWREAVAEYRKVIEKQPCLIEAYLYLGNILHLLERHDEAITVYKCALMVTAEDDATWHHICGQIEACKANYAAAAREFQQASLLEPNNIIHRQYLGLTYLRAGMPVKALQIFDQSLKKNADDTVALTYSYTALTALGRTIQARRRITRALRLDPENVPAIKLLADQRSQAGEVYGEEGKETRQLIRRALRLAPNVAETHESSALYYIFRGEWERGLSILSAFTERHPNSPAGWLSYARWLFRTGKTESARLAINQAYGLDSCHYETLQTAAKIYAQARDLDRLRFLLDEMLRWFSEQWCAWATVARLLIESMKDAERACTVSAHGLQLEPRLAAARLQHGRVLALAGRHAEAINALVEGWEQLPEDASDTQPVIAALWLGESNRLLGQERRAREWFERAMQKALALSSHHPSIIHYRRGQALEALGDRLGAVQSYVVALEHHLLYPARRKAQEKLKRLEARLRVTS